MADTAPHQSARATESKGSNIVCPYASLRSSSEATVPLTSTKSLMIVIKIIRILGEGGGNKVQETTEGTKSSPSYPATQDHFIE